ncbi:MAG: hypothetical protein U9O94_04965 [Nanoarchaeota archaeon]|nr:hypothetical protein [Nanoarchaeota archaeon]
MNIEQQKEVDFRFENYIGELTKEEFTQEFLAIELNRENKILKKYLSDTDWYYVRKIETGEDVPVEVITKRLEVRETLKANGL